MLTTREIANELRKIAETCGDMTINHRTGRFIVVKALEDLLEPLDEQADMEEATQPDRPTTGPAPAKREPAGAAK